MAVKETVECFAFIEALGVAVVEAKADGKFDYNDLGLLLPVASKAREAAVGISEVAGEIKNANSEELELIAQSMASAITALMAAWLA